MQLVAYCAEISFYMKRSDDRIGLLINAIGLFWGGVYGSFFAADAIYQKLVENYIGTANFLFGVVVAFFFTAFWLYLIGKLRVNLFSGAKKVIAIVMVLCFFFMSLWELYANLTLSSADGGLVLGVLFFVLFCTVDQYDD